MSFDNSRITFDPLKNYSGVVMEQGRVQTDADWNEWLAELSRRIQAGTLDMMGRAVYPATTPDAFRIVASVVNGANTILIGPGRMYVDGLLAENHGTNPVWDPALAEVSGSPQPPPTPAQARPHFVDFNDQPCVPAGGIPPGDGPFLAYLDVWNRPVTYIEDPALVDPAIGIDTTGRIQTAWQVNLVAVPGVSDLGCGTPDSALPWPVSQGRLTINTVPGGPSGPCCLTTGTGYTGLENQFYRIEIHTGGSIGTSATPGPTGAATFKWSKENASVQTKVMSVGTGSNTAGGPANVLTVASLGRDQVLGFSAGNWIEVTSQSYDDNCKPGELYQIDHVEVSTSTITLTTQLSSAMATAISKDLGSNKYARISRWDQKGKIFTSDNALYYDLDEIVAPGTLANGFYGIPVPPAGTALILENGITVTFNVENPGNFLAMDYWNFAARTADGSLDPQLTDAPPRGIYHHRTKLSVVTFGTAPTASNCRTEWPSAGESECGCCTCTVGVGKEGKYQRIQDAIDALPSQGGEICILPGDYYENVLVENGRNVVIRGCGWQTRIFSSDLARGGKPDESIAIAKKTESGLRAVFTAIGCTNLEFRSFSIHAASEEAGILLDRAPVTYKSPSAGDNRFQPEFRFVIFGKADTDVIVEDLVISASNLPGIVAAGVTDLKIAENRITLTNVDSVWPAVYLNGDDIFFERNWVGMETTQDRVISNRDIGEPEAEAVLEDSVVKDTIPNAPGGIQVAGPSDRVFIVENEISGGRYNGITLGNYIIPNSDGSENYKPTPLWLNIESICSTAGTIGLPGTTTGDNPVKIAAGGLIRNLHIDRNLIQDTGMCGIGPVGFFDLDQVLEVISLENVSITSNIISNTLKRAFEVSPEFGGGAICLPDVSNLIIRDNVITNFGVTPGVEVCGIFVLHGEMTEISRNQIKETRDLAAGASNTVDSFGGYRAGILIALVTPPTLDISGSDSNSSPAYVPGLPALRIQENSVRVAIGLALEVLGVGPFHIIGNQFGTGGTVVYSNSQAETGRFPPGPDVTDTPAGAVAVSILNLGNSIEQADLAASSFAGGVVARVEVPKFAGVPYPSSGAVLFSNNICQFESVLSGVRGFASVVVMSLDQVLFSNNQLWFNGLPFTACVDAFIFAATVQVSSNRLQEAAGYPVFASGRTIGFLNITSQNIATYCLITEALPGGRRMYHENLSLWCPVDKRKPVDELIQ